MDVHLATGSAHVYQPALPGFCPLDAAVSKLAGAEAEERGAIFTRREVVHFILDLVGYTTDARLDQMRFLEPSFGHGDFLIPAIERLLTSMRAAGRVISAPNLKSCVRGIELHHGSYEKTSVEIENLLLAEGMKAREAKELCGHWLICNDFLLAELPANFTHVVGNPPYLRQGSIPQVLIDEYRRRYTTIYDRADLYVPFIERSLRLLAPGGKLGFICADRWMKNRYGGPLRKFVADHFHLRAYVDMVDTPAFHSDVVAYPAIFVIGNERTTVTRIAHRPRLEEVYLAGLAGALRGEAAHSSVTESDVIANGDAPWLLEANPYLDAVRRLERDFPTIEEAGCKVGIGVATGADRAFIDKMETLDVEADRKLPLVMTRDIAGGAINWRGYGVINPFADDGRLVDLRRYPRLARHLADHKVEIAERHVAKKTPDNWYRTIDRIYPALVERPKLLIPDIKGEANIVYDPGRYYPHHNLYFITSDSWDLEALQAVLLSGIARLFITTYSTKMRGGFLRFQAQYLRRIRIPNWQNVSQALRSQLHAAAHGKDIAACNRAVIELYGLTLDEQGFLSEIQSDEAT